MSHMIDIDNLNSFPKFVAPKSKVKVKATVKVKTTFLAITSVLLKPETWNQRHFVPLLKAFLKYAIRFDVTPKEVRQNDVIRWRHFWKCIFCKTAHMTSWGMIPICHTQNLSSFGQVVLTLLTFLFDVFDNPSNMQYFSCYILHYLHSCNIKLYASYDWHRWSE